MNDDILIPRTRHLLLEEASQVPEGHRPGQHAFNTVWMYFPTIANSIRSGENDPFYDDSALPRFWEDVFSGLNLWVINNGLF